MIIDKTKITTAKVAEVLNSKSRDVGTLCTHASINPWAKFKPVNLSDPRPDRASDWWKGDNEWCGFKIGVKDPNTNRINRTRSLDDIPNANWYYDPVTKANPKRLADFGGYDSEAIPCIASRIETDTVDIYRSKNNKTHTFAFDVYNLGDGNGLGLNDFPFLKNYYLGAAIKVNNVWREFRGDPIVNGNGEVDIKIGGLSDGLYDCILFATTSDNPEMYGDIIPLPNDNLNRTHFKINLNLVFSFRIDLKYVSKSIEGPWTFINNIPDGMPPEETPDGGYIPATGGFKCPHGGTLYYKGNIVRTSRRTDTINDFEFRGHSDSFTSETGSYENGLGGAIFDKFGYQLDKLTTPGFWDDIGYSEEIIIRWSFTGERDWTDNDPIDIGGALDVYYNESYLGGSSDFMLYR